jgi:pimeloyl-ACP methyl ester carboxylesterase
VTTSQELRVSQPTVTRLDVAHPRAVVLMLHGGKEQSTTPVGDGSLSRRRSLAMMRTLAPALGARDVSVWLTTYRVRGWNGGTGPVADARWALDEVRRELGDVPVCLLGHSMGARTAVHVADDPSVVGVVGLAPWWPADESVEALRGKRLVGAHGRRDKITSPRASRVFLERAAEVARSATMHDMGPVGHYLLRRVDVWNDLARSASLAMLG